MCCVWQTVPGLGGPWESERKQSWQALGVLAYLQKRKAERGLEGLPGLDGVGLRLLGVRLQVKITSFRVGEMIAVQIAQLAGGTGLPLGPNHQGLITNNAR